MLSFGRFRSFGEFLDDYLETQEKEERRNLPGVQKKIQENTKLVYKFLKKLKIKNYEAGLVEHKLTKYMMYQLNLNVRPGENVYHIGIIDVDEEGIITSLLFKNNMLAVSEKLLYKYESELCFKNIAAMKAYFNYLFCSDNMQLMLDSYISSAM